jgi:hypothetical protein
MRKPLTKEKAMEHKNCEIRIDEHLRSRVADLKRLLAGEENDEIGTLANYALGFDYVVADTFSDQPEGYFRYQISWGGPSDEFRFFVNPDLSRHRIEYWFLDWFDGAHRICSNDLTARRLWLWLEDAGAVRLALREAAAE